MRASGRNVLEARFAARERLTHTGAVGPPINSFVSLPAHALLFCKFLNKRLAHGGLGFVF